MWRNVASNGITFLVVLLFLTGGMIAWGKTRYVAPGPLAQAICLKVDRGTTMKKVSYDLAERGAVSSGSIYRIGVGYAGKAQQLKAGSYLVPEGASMREIVDIVTRGGQSTCGTEIVYRIGVRRNQVQVRALDPATGRYVERAAFNPAEDAVPAIYEDTRREADVRLRIAMAEGVTSWQVVEALKAAEFLKGTVGDIPPEGMLAPDSYEVRNGDTRVSVLERMQAAQVAILDAAWENRAADLPFGTKEEALVLASIVEKETGVARERRQVASVFVNRLNKGIRLQTDPAVIYGITKGEGILGRGLRQSELRRETPYNTYVIAGLPPTPIANPGRAAIEAALDPDSTDYIFFVADGTGGHAFARTLKEHNANVARWRRIEAERNSGN
jgi:UPF0755 protein